MTDDPETCADKALDHGVDCPEDHADGQLWDVFGCDIGVPKKECDRQTCDISDDVREAS